MIKQQEPHTPRAKPELHAVSRHFVSVIAKSGLLLACLALTTCSSKDEETPLGDGSNDGAVVLNHDNYIDVIGYVLGIYAGKIYDPAILVGQEFVTDNEPISVEIINPEFNVTRSIYGCVNGGSATITASSSAAGAERTLNQVYENCEWKERVHAGQVLYQLEPYGRNSWTYTDFSLTDREGHRVVPMGMVRRDYNQCKVDSYDTWSAELDRYEAESAAGTTVLASVSTDFSYGLACSESNARLGGTFTVRSPDTGGELLTVNTPVELSNPLSDARNFVTGRLEVRASDNNSIVLDTDDSNDDAASVATVLMIDGEKETQSLTWDTWTKELTFD